VKVWEPQSEGRFGVIARAFDGDGAPQSELRARAFPSGIEGYHRVWVDVAMASDNDASKPLF